MTEFACKSILIASTILFSAGLVAAGIEIVEDVDGREQSRNSGCTGDGFFVDPNNGAKFYRCMSTGEVGSFRKFEFECLDGSTFDMQSFNCNSNVTDAGRSEVRIRTKSSSVYFDEKFNSNPFTKWTSIWVNSISLAPDAEHQRGHMIWSAGKVYHDAEFERGLMTFGQQKFYGISATFPRFSTTDDRFVLQYSVKFEQDELDCAGGYMKLFDCSFEPQSLNVESRYLMSFGPSQCPNETVHLNIHHQLPSASRGITKEYMLFKSKRPTGFNGDQRTRVYTLIIEPDDNRSFVVLEDGRIIKFGNYKQDVPNFNGWETICAAGFEVYQSNGGTVFDNVLLTSDMLLAEERRNEILRTATRSKHVVVIPK